MLRIAALAGGGLVVASLIWWGVSSLLDARDEAVALRETAKALQAEKAASDTAQATLNEKKKEIEHARTERESTLDGAADLPDDDFWRVLDRLLSPDASAGGGDAPRDPDGAVPGTAEQRRRADTPAIR